MKKLVILLLVLSVCWFAQVAPSYAKLEGRSLPAAHLNKASADYMTRTLVNIGNVAMWIFSDGTSANMPNGNSGLFYPRASTPTTAVIFQDGFVFGGVVNDGIEPAIRVGGQTYTIGTVPGAIVSKGVREDYNDNSKVDRVWRVRKDFATLTDDDLRLDAAEINSVNAADVTSGQIAQLRATYKADWLDWPTYKGAPFYDANGDGLYTPQFNADGTPVLYPDGDEPGYANGDQVVWLCVNDLDEATSQSLAGAPPSGIELQITLWAYKRADAMGNIIFKQFRMIYKGRTETPANATITDLHVCQWSDPDNGESGDDFAGCDTTLSLGYVYNANASDATYAAAGYPPAAGGYDFFAGPMVPSDDPNQEGIFGLKKRLGYKNLPMTSFAFFAAGQEDSDPDMRSYNGTLQWWNLLRGYKPRPQYPEGTRWTNPQTGETTMFRVPGDPVTGSGWIDENTGDRRILLVSGPTDISLGDTVEVVVAVAGGMGSDRLSSVSVLKFFDRFAQGAFDVLFELPSAPPKPTMLATELDQKVLLNWAVDATAVAKVENFNDKGYAFEGYNLYQLPSAGATANQGIKLATFDVNNGVTTIVQESFDAASGLVLSLPAQIGKDTGISRTLTVSTDRLRDMPLANGRMYYFGISSYSYNGTPGLTTTTLESPLTIVAVVPQTTKPGVRLTTDIGSMLEVAHASGSSEGVVTAQVIDNTRLTGHEYKVTFRDVEGESVWDLTDVTTGEVKLSGQVNQSGDDDYLIIDGVQVKVTGPTTAGLKDNGYNYVPSGNRFLTAFNDAAGAAPLWHMEGWAGLFGWADNFFGTGLPATECKNVEIRFAACDEKGVPTDMNDPNVSMAYRYMRGVGATSVPAKPEFEPFIIRKAGGYPYQDMRPVCFAAYDMESNPPRRLNVGFNENNTSTGLVNGAWMPGRYDTEGGMNATREFLFVFASDYSTTPQAMYTENDMLNTVTNTDLMYVGVPSRRGARLPVAGDKVVLEANHFNTPNDVFTFSTVSPTNLTADAVNDVEKINVFPNPYYGFNIVEKNQFSRFVTFNHLPAKATIRIFSLAGVLVDVIEKNDPSQFVTWNLLNNSDLPVASGVYLVHIDMPDLGKTKTLKLAVVREQQFLTIY
jgi:hypothetical protein